MLGVRLLPWQRWWAIHALERRRTGAGFRYRTILTLVGRQNGKTTLLKCLALWMLYLGRARLVLGVAQNLDIAKESWQGAVELAEAVPELSAEVANVRRANGEQELRLTSGARYKIAAATRRAGRSLSVDLVILDELREQQNFEAWGALSKTTMARPDSVIVGISNAGDDQSVVLNQLRAAALAGGTDTLGIFEWSAPDGCALDDLDAIAQANPGLGHTISLESIDNARATDPPEVFRTEVLCQRVAALDAAVSQDAWKACADVAATVTDLKRRYACVDVAPDLRHATLAVAAVAGDGRIHLVVADAWDGPNATKQMLAALPGLLGKIKPKTLGWFGSGPAAAVATDLSKIRIAEKLAGEQVPQICQGLAQAVESRRVVHPMDPLMSAHVLAAKKLYAGDGWRFGRRGVGHVDAAYAAAGALHLARSQPARTGSLVLVGRVKPKQQ